MGVNRNRNNFHGSRTQAASLMRISLLKFEPRVSNFPNHISHYSVAYMIATMKIISVSIHSPWCKGCLSRNFTATVKMLFLSIHSRWCRGRLWWFFNWKTDLSGDKNSKKRQVSLGYLSFLFYLLIELFAFS